MNFQAKILMFPENYAIRAQTRLGEKLQTINDWCDKCLILGDLNRPPNKTKELPITGLMTEWIKSGEDVLLNDPKIFIKFGPHNRKRLDFRHRNSYPYSTQK